MKAFKCALILLVSTAPAAAFIPARAPAGSAFVVSSGASLNKGGDRLLRRSLYQARLRSIDGLAAQSPTGEGAEDTDDAAEGGVPEDTKSEEEMRKQIEEEAAAKAAEIQERITTTAQLQAEERAKVQEKASETAAKKEQDDFAKAKENAAKAKEQLEELTARIEEIKGRAKKIAERSGSSFLLAPAEGASEFVSDASSAISKYNPGETVDNLRARDESNIELVRETASGLARAAADGFGTGVELVDSFKGDDELKKVVEDALDAAGAAASAIGEDDSMGDEEIMATLQRKAKLLYFALDSLGIAAYATLSGIVGYSQEGTAVNESASRAGDGISSAVGALSTLGIRSADAAIEAANAAKEAERLEEERQYAIANADKIAFKKEADKRIAAKEAARIEAATKAIEEANKEASKEKEAEEPAAGVIEENEEVSIEDKEEEKVAEEQVSVVDVPAVSKMKSSNEVFQRSLLAARLEMEKAKAPATDTAINTATVSKDGFQRSLLAARLEMERKH